MCIFFLVHQRCHSKCHSFESGYVKLNGLHFTELLLCLILRMTEQRWCPSILIRIKNIVDCNELSIYVFIPNKSGNKMLI